MNVADRVLGFLEGVSGDRVKRGFWFHKRVLRFLGFNLWKRQKSIWSSVVNLLFFFCQVFSQISMFIFGMSSVFSMEVKCDEDLALQVKNVTLCLALLASSFKALFLFYKRNSVMRLVTYLEELGETPSTKPHLRQALVSSVLYMGLACANGLASSTYTPLINGGEFPIKAIYPWDTEHSLFGKAAGWVTQWTSTVCCLVYHGCVDTMVSVYIGVLCQHVLILKRSITRLGTSSPTDDERIISGFVDMHNKVLRGVEMVNETAGLLYVFEVFFIIVFACLDIFLIIQVDDFGSTVANIAPMLAASYAALLLYSYFGQKLTSQMEELREAVTGGEWYSCSEKVKSSLYIIGEMCKRPAQLRGGGNVFTANYHTYLQSLHDSFSYFLIMKTMTSHND